MVDQMGEVARMDGADEVEAGIEKESSVKDFRAVTRESLLESKRQRQQGYRFDLILSGGYARVSIPNVADRAVYGRMPEAVQSVMAEELLRSQSPQLKDVEDAIHRLAQVVADQELLANHLCIIGFLEPVLVEKEEEAVGGKAWVEDIHYEDRIAYMELVLAGERAAARKLKRFPESAVGDVSGQSSHQAASESVRVSRAEGIGVQ
jgi:hypothetical protein